MSKPHFREISERRLSEDYDHEAPLDLSSVRAHAHRIAHATALLRKRSSLHQWDQPDSQSDRSVVADTNDEPLREIALMKLLMNGNDVFNRPTAGSYSGEDHRLPQTLAKKYFLSLTSDEIWTLMCKRTRCGHTFFHCLTQAKDRNDPIVGYVSHEIPPKCTVRKNKKEPSQILVYSLITVLDLCLDSNHWTANATRDSKPFYGLASWNTMALISAHCRWSQALIDESHR